MSTWLEVRIPISPVEHYFNRIHMIAHSIRSLGGPYTDVRIRVSVGSDSEPYDLYSRLPWSRRAGVEWVWVGREDFRKWEHTEHKYIATMMERFRPPFTTRQVLMLDADIMVMREFDELSTQLDAAPGLAAVMAHSSPAKWPADQAAWWGTMYASAGLEMPPFEHEYSGWGIMERVPSRRLGPPYFNTGVVLANAPVLERLYDTYMRELDVVRSVEDTYFFEQIALTLALQATGIAPHVAPLRYNFPNQQQFDELHPTELENVRFLHFLRTDVIHRETDFETSAAAEKLAGRTDLKGSNEAFRRRLAALLPLIAADSAAA